MEWKTLLSDQEAMREAYHATRDTRTPVKNFHPDSFDPFVGVLYTEASACVAVVSIDGKTRFCVNPLFSTEYADVEKLTRSMSNRLWSTPLDILGR